MQAATTMRPPPTHPAPGDSNQPRPRRAKPSPRYGSPPGRADTARQPLGPCALNRSPRGDAPRRPIEHTGRGGEPRHPVRPNDRLRIRACASPTSRPPCLSAAFSSSNPSQAGPRTDGLRTQAGPHTAAGPRKVAGPRTAAGPRKVAGPRTAAGLRTAAGPRTPAGPRTLPGFPKRLSGPGPGRCLERCPSLMPVETKTVRTRTPSHPKEGDRIRRELLTRTCWARMRCSWACTSSNVPTKPVPSEQAKRRCVPAGAGGRYADTPVDERNGAAEAAADGDREPTSRGSTGTDEPSSALTATGGSSGGTPSSCRALSSCASELSSACASRWAYVRLFMRRKCADVPCIRKRCYIRGATRCTKFVH